MDGNSTPQGMVGVSQCKSNIRCRPWNFGVDVGNGDSPSAQYGPMAHIRPLAIEEIRIKPTEASDAAAVNEVQTLTITGTPTGGTFTITYEGETTAAIAYNASAADVKDALEALSNIDEVTCTGGDLPGTPVVVTFTGDTVKATDVALMTTTDSLTGGDSPESAIVETTKGVALADATAKLKIGIQSQDDALDDDAILAEFDLGAFEKLQNIRITQGDFANTLKTKRSAFLLPLIPVGYCPVVTVTKQSVAGQDSGRIEVELSYFEQDEQ